MLALEEKIDKFYAETDESVDAVTLGSDEHLDLILSITNSINRITVQFEEFNNFLYAEINTLAIEDLNNSVLPRLRLLNKACLAFIGAVIESAIYSHVREPFRKYRTQHSLLTELIHDIQNIRLAKDDEFDNLLNELNDL